MMDPLSLTTFPSVAERRLLPAFVNLPRDQIHLINTAAQCRAIQEQLDTVHVFGFDTESKPTFNANEKSTGPHLLQLATDQHAYLFQINAETLAFLAPLLSNPKQLKVGFALKSDVSLLRSKGIELAGTVDLSKSFHVFGIKQQVGAQNAVAILLRQYLPKSKHTKLSNWSKFPLTEAQIDYACADAYASLRIYEELKRRNLLTTPRKGR